MDERLKEMLDHYEIRKTLAEYCHACDRADEALMRSVYAGDDSWDDHGHVKAKAPEYCRVMTNLVLERTEAISHILGQSLIKVEGDRAGAETFFLAFMRLPGADGARDRMNQLVGRFVDELERIDGRWRISKRLCVRDTSMTTYIERDDYAGYGFIQGGRDAADPGAALIGIAHRAGASDAP